MKNVILIAILFVFAFQSCKDDDVTPEITPTPSFNLVTSPGSYWIYEYYYIDTLGNERLGGTDSVYIEGESTINNKTFISYSGTEFGSNKSELLRDSLGIIVTSNGNAIWNNNGLSDLDSWTIEYLSLNSSITNLSSSVTVPAGTFKSIQRTIEVCRTDGSPVNPCYQCLNHKAYYAEGVGEILYQTAYIGNENCDYLERRLIRYNIQ